MTDSRGLCYLNIDWDLSQTSDRISASAAEPKRLQPPTATQAMIGGRAEIKNNSCFSNLGFSHPCRGFPIGRKSNLPNCKWAAGID